MKKAVQAEKQVKSAAIREYQTSLNANLGTLLDASLAFTKQFHENWKDRLDLCMDGIDAYVDAVKQNIDNFALRFE